MKAQVALVVLLVFQVLAKTTYENYQVLEYSVSNEEEATTLVNLAQHHPERLSLWNEQISIPGKITFQVAPHGRELLRKLSIPFTIIHADLQQTIDEFFAENLKRAQESDNFFDSYKNYEEIQQFLNRLVEQYPSLATLVKVGTSLENRDINGIVISGETYSNKPSIVIDALQHAREWIAPMTVTYVAQQFLESYAADDKVKQLVDAFSWTIIPVVNPDGYEYSWSTDRLWRKNRRFNPGSNCYGVDLNRNWAYQWGTGGSSSLPCADTYMGPSPFSEPEETSVANYIAGLENVVGYIDFHAYGELFMYPWGYTCSAWVANNITQDTCGSAFASAVQSVNGLNFGVGPVCLTIYQASGGSNDWTYGATGVPYSYSCELRGNSFILPPQEIIPSGEEIWAGIQAFGIFVQSNN